MTVSGEMTPERWRGVEAALDHLRALPAEQRPDALDEVCADPVVRREVEALLAVETEADGFLETPVRTLPPSTGFPRRFGPYRVEKRIGRGGMGEVFLAHRADGEFHQRVAVKWLDADPARTDLVRRFRDERQILAGLEHPYIARLIGGGTTDDGRPYLVMEHVEGEPIDSWCSRHESGIEARLRLFSKVCDAVQAAHRRLIVHRDLKPKNILVDAAGEPKLLDFGIAKVLASETEPAFRDVPSGPDSRWMTPAYASPEQVLGAPITTATDVHALGLLLYELLAGKRAFRGGDAVELAREIEKKEPQPPSRVVSEPGRRRRIDGDLDAIVARALRKAPEERYGSAADLAADVRRHLEHRPVSARRPTFRYLAGRFARRNRLGFALASALGILIVGFALTSFHLWRHAAEGQARAEEVAAFLEDLYQLPDPRRSEGATVTALELLERSARSLERELEEQPADRSRLLLAIGSAYRGLGQNETAADFLARGLALDRATAGAKDRRRVQGLLDLAAVERALGRAGASSAFEEARAILETGGIDHPRLARLLNNHASLLEWEGDFRRAEILFREALAMKLRLWGSDHEDVATAWNNLATTLWHQGKWSEAEDLYREALDFRRVRFGADSPQTSSSRNNLAVLRRDQGELEVAEKMLREDLAIRRRLLGAEHPALGTVLNNLAMTRQWAGDSQEAGDLYAEAFRLFESAYGPEHVNTAVVARNRAELVLAAGDPERAEALVRGTVEVFRLEWGDAHWRVADAQSLLGAILARQGRSEEASALLRDSLRLLAAAKGDRARETREAEKRMERFLRDTDNSSRSPS